MRWPSRIWQYSEQQTGAAGFVIGLSRIFYTWWRDILPQPSPFSDDFGGSSAALPNELGSVGGKHGEQFGVAIPDLCKGNEALGVTSSRCYVSDRMEYLVGVRPAKAEFIEKLLSIGQWNDTLLDTLSNTLSQTVSKQCHIPARYLGIGTV